MLYHVYDMQHAALAPARMAIGVVEDLFRNPFFPLAHTPMGRSVVAGCEVAERVTRRYGKPEFDIASTVVDGREVAVAEVPVLARRFCTLLHFQRDTPRPDPKVLLVAPMSGHHATLLRGTVRTLLPDHDVFITDWVNARDVPASAGPFGLDDYIDSVINFLEMLGPDVHVIAVCQPSVPVLAAVSLMAEDAARGAPRSMVLMGGPIDTRVNPTRVNEVAEQQPLSWFEQHCVSRVPLYYPGYMRRVHPGFLQLTGFMGMNLDRHVDAHLRLFNHLVAGDGDSAEAHRRFYDEYMSVMDLPAEYYLDSLRVVFKEHHLPERRMTWRGRPVDPHAVSRTALMTVEGANDDITGVGQTRAAHDICANIPADRRAHHVQDGVGHFGVFNGRRWRESIHPRISEFIRAHA